MPTHPTVSLAQLPLEIILYIGTFVDHTSLRSLRATCDGMCKLLTPTAFGTFLVRLGSMGLRKRLAHIEHPEPSLPTQGTYKPSMAMLSHIRVCRIELGNASAYQDSSYVVHHLCVLQPAVDMKRLEVVLTAPSDAHVGAFYAFSAVVSQLSACLPYLPSDELEVMDLSRPDLRITGTKSSFKLSLASKLEAAAYVSMPNWVFYCIPHITHLSLSRVIVDANLMRGLYHIMPSLHEIVLADCAINHEVNMKSNLTWAFLWDTAKNSAQWLHTIDVTGCGYFGRTPESGEAAVQREVLLKTDAEDLGALEENVRSHVPSEDLSRKWMRCCPRAHVVL